MEANSILSANILDILFDGRNKEYGAYDLRRTYNKRIGSALGATAIVIIIFIVAATWITTNSRKSIVKTVLDLTLSNDRKREKILQPVPHVLPKPKQVRTIADPPPIIVIDRIVTEPPIENSKLTDVRIGTRTVDGPIDNTIPPGIDINDSQVKSESAVKKEVD